MTVEAAIAAWSAGHSLTRHRLIGVSGGRDSMVLLHALHRAGARLTICHVDHRLRGAASTGDARFVTRTAARLGIPSLSTRVDVARLAGEEKLSLEAAGRLARHRFFTESARATRTREVLMAHHADDQVETVLMHLFRGSAGLRGIRSQAMLTAPGSRISLTIHRPLLEVSRAEIDTWASAHRIKWREDSTNHSGCTVRNRLRLELLPALQTAMGRDIRPALLRATAIASDEDEYLDSLASPYVTDHLDAAILQPLHPALQRRIFRLWLEAQKVSGTGAREVEALRSLLHPATGPSRINLPDNFHASRSRMLISLEKPRR